MKVANKKCIRSLALKRMKSARSANTIAVIAIALTSLLFTALFTVVMSFVYSYEQSNFRQVGTYSHGSFKYISEELFNEFKDDPDIKEYGDRMFVGMCAGDEFLKYHTEVSYADENYIKWGFLEPDEGELPRENTAEAAVDSDILDMLGIPHEIGTKFELTFRVDGTETTESFILSGILPHDGMSPAYFVQIPKSRALEIFGKLGTEGLDGMTTRHDLYIMLGSSKNIEGRLKNILERHGFQSDEKSQENFIDIGVNWGYANSQVSLDFETVVMFAAFILLITFTGYLIIYGVFRISVSNDICYYGLLKTIGTTGRQIKRIILIQSMTLSAVGIPIGLILGYGFGALLTPVVLDNLNGIEKDALSVSPWIFVFSAVFSAVTVMISCRKPGKIAAKVSPVEALRYTERGGTETVRKNKKAASITRMAAANLGRSRSKTVTTIASLSLAAILFNLSFAAMKGFNMDEYISNKIVSDFLVSSADFFNYHGSSLDEEILDAVSSENGIDDGGVTYIAEGCSDFPPEEHFIDQLKAVGNSDEIAREVAGMEYWRIGGRLASHACIYGMEDFCLDKLKVIEGDIEKVISDEKCIAAVYSLRDDGTVYDVSNFLKLGDTVEIHTVTEREYVNSDTGEVLDSLEGITDPENYEEREKSGRTDFFTVAALVDLPYSLSKRYSTVPGDEFIVSAKSFKEHFIGGPLYYSFNMEDDAAVERMNNFLEEYCEGKNADFESRRTMEEEYSSFNNMITLCTMSLSFVIGIIGILNFINAVLTGIFTRRRELAVLQSIGMTGAQLRRMLVTEGLFYTLGALAVSFALTAVIIPLSAASDLDILTVFSLKLSPVPTLILLPVFVLLGIMLPALTYRSVSKQTLVERLRVDE